jgi:uncharacterized protein YegL
MNESSNLNKIMPGRDTAGTQCACMFLIDTSSSMEHNDRIGQVNAGLATLKKLLDKNEIATAGVELALITFNDKVDLVQDFAYPGEFNPPVLSASGLTYMGTAIIEALEKIEMRRSYYKTMGLPSKIPLLFILTDGLPEGEPPAVIEKASALLKQRIKEQKVHVWPVTVGAAIETSQLASITGVGAKRLDETKWEEMWKWLSRSLSVISASRPGEKPKLPDDNFSYGP